MNNARRASIKKAVEHLELAHSILEECTEEEQEYYDAMPESLQQSDRGTESEEAISSLETATDSAQEAIDAVSDLVGS